MPQPPDEQDQINYDAAEMYLSQAKTAHDAGDEHRSAAARKMVAIALGLDDWMAPIIHTGHLKKS